MMRLVFAAALLAATIVACRPFGRDATPPDEGASDDEPAVDAGSDAPPTQPGPNTPPRCEDCAALGGVCSGGRCVRNCSSFSPCKGIACPPNLPCELNCSGANACKDASCGGATSCNIHCVDAASCSGGLDCGLALQCSIVCEQSSTGPSCNGPVLTCTRPQAVCAAQCVDNNCPGMTLRCCPGTSCSSQGGADQQSDPCNQ